MNKRELVQAISKEMNGTVPQDKIRSVLDAAVKVVIRTLEAGEPVKFAGCGTLVAKERPPRRIYSPARKGYVMSKGLRKIVFLPSRIK